MVDVEDHVLEEYDVLVSTALMSHLHLLQLPAPSFSDRLARLCESHGPDAVLSSRFKPQNGVLEIDIPMDTSHHTFDEERSERFAREALCTDGREEVERPRLDHQRLTGTCLPCNNGILMLGTIFQGNLHFTPVSSVIPLSIDFGYLDAARAKAKVASKKPLVSDDDDEGKPVQVQFKKRETEEQMTARLNSYAYLQRQLDDEPWVNLKLYPSQSEESVFLTSKLLDMDNTSKGKAIPLVCHRHDYLKALTQK